MKNVLLKISFRSGSKKAYNYGVVAIWGTKQIIIIVFFAQAKPKAYHYLLFCIRGQTSI